MAIYGICPDTAEYEPGRFGDIRSVVLGFKNGVYNEIILFHIAVYAFLLDCL
jgi:hypothetical protein